jgi:hypothetical protein
MTSYPEVWLHLLVHQDFSHLGGWHVVHEKLINHTGLLLCQPFSKNLCIVLKFCTVTNTGVEMRPNFHMIKFCTVTNTGVLWAAFLAKRVLLRVVETTTFFLARDVSVGSLVPSSG